MVIHQDVTIPRPREEMASMDLDLLIVPLDSEGRLKWVSGFSGSNGQAVISGDEGRGCGWSKNI